VYSVGFYLDAARPIRLMESSFTQNMVYVCRLMDIVIGTRSLLSSTLVNAKRTYFFFSLGRSLEYLTCEPFFLKIIDAGHNLHYLSEEAAKAWKGLEDTLQIMKIGKWLSPLSFFSRSRLDGMHS
jgi:hypothetical protein